jgi:putative nucleotidyltransferase with HDIG domain
MVAGRYITMIESTLNDDVAVLPKDIQADLVERIEAGNLELPLLSDVVWQVMDLSASDRVDARMLSDLIHRDPALAGHVLHVANSPAYMPRMPIVSLQQAISRLGTTVLCEIAFAVALQSRVFDVKGYENELLNLWKHSVGAAAFAKEIARVRQSNVEGAFLCGLLHDVGKPIILQMLLDLQSEQGLTLEPSLVSAIMEAYHTQVGSMIAGEWALPPHVCESIAYHHDYLVAPTCAEAVMVTRLADCLSYHSMLPEIFDEERIRHHPVLADLRFSPDHVEAVLARRQAVKQIIEAMS